MSGKENGAVFRKKAKPEDSSEPDRIWMSVKEMGDLLGIRKTDRYWLVHKNVFETSMIRGKMWVNIESFEKWYANQVKYRKVTGEEPGLELKEWSLSPQDIAQLLEIPEYRVYELIKEKNWETVTVDFWTRVRRDSFEKWYQSQKHYRTSAGIPLRSGIRARNITGQLKTGKTIRLWKMLLSHFRRRQQYLVCPESSFI